MKINVLVKNILYLAMLFTLANCKQEPPLDSDFAVSVENIDSLYAGAAVVFNISGNADYFTIYTGDSLGSSHDKNHIYGNESRATGFQANSGLFRYTYKNQGTYNVVVLASSYGNWSESATLKMKEFTITINDSRATFSKISVSGYGSNVFGKINNVLSTVNFANKDLTDVKDYSNAILTFSTSSEDCRVFVDDVEQFSGVTPNDFSDENPVRYKLVAFDGTVKTYEVIINQRITSTNDSINWLKIAKSRNSTVFYSGDINYASKIIMFELPFGFNPSAVFGIASAPVGGVVIGNGNPSRPLGETSSKPVNLLNPIKVVSESLDTSVYTFDFTFEPAVSGFSFNGFFPIPYSVIVDPDFQVSGSTGSIDVYISPNIDITNLKPVFNGSDELTLTIGNPAIPFVKGVTSYDFLVPVDLKISGNAYFWDGAKWVSKAISVTYVITVHTT